MWRHARSLLGFRRIAARLPGKERPGALLHPLEGIDLPVRRRSEVPELAGRHQDAALERADAPVVGVHGAVQALPEAGEVTGHGRDAFVEEPPQAADLL